eukprot:symbB.v1.2.026841.t1/scaffold2588.1/size75582/4
MSPGRATRHRPGATASHGHQGHAHGVRMDDLLESMEEDPQYVELVTHHQRKFRISPEDMLSFVRQLGQLCMSMLVASGGGAPEAMASKLQRLQRDLKIVKEESKAKLVQCNLNALKQLDVVKGGTGGWDDKVIFYEPMQYLNEDEKEMVFMVVKDKLRQVLDGTAPDSFMGKIKTSLGMADADKLVKKGPRLIAPVHEEEEEDDFEHDAVVKARTEAKRSQDAATVARREVEEIKKRITQLQQQLEDRGVELAEAQQLLAQGERYREQLLLAMDRLKLQPEEASFVMSELSKSTEGFQVVFDDLPQDCTFLELAQWHDGIGAVSPVAIELHQDTRRRRKSAVCRYAEEPQAEAAVRQLQTSAASKGGRWASVRARLLPSKQKASQDNAEANRATGDSWRSKSKLNTTGSWSQDLRKPQVSPQPQVPSESSKSKATAKLEEARMELQAELGKKAKAIEAGLTWGCMEDMTKENKKLKVCLEELQAKLRQVMEKSKERGIGEELSEIAHDVGLKRVLSCPSRFDILYQDAFKRIERLEELRAKIREERQRTVIGAAVSVDPSEPSVLSLVERSPLVILQQLVSTGPAGWSLACSHSPKRGRAHPPLWLQWGWGMLLF